MSLMSPALAGGFFTTTSPGKLSTVGRGAGMLPLEKNKPLWLEFGVFLKWNDLGLQWTND